MERSFRKAKKIARELGETENVDQKVENIIDKVKWCCVGCPCPGVFRPKQKNRKLHNLYAT